MRFGGRGDSSRRSHKVGRDHANLSQEQQDHDRAVDNRDPEPPFHYAVWVPPDVTKSVTVVFAHNVISRMVFRCFRRKALQRLFQDGRYVGIPRFARAR
jgi:hypothetical protein